jgi:capsid protein
LVESLSYDGAKSGRRTDGWFRPGTSANVETAQGLAKLRDGARDLVRNNPLAAKALTELRTKAVGTGIVPQARTQNDAVNKRLDELFAAWSAECNSDGQPGFAGMQALAASCIVESGECLLAVPPAVAERRADDSAATADARAGLPGSHAIGSH